MKTTIQNNNALCFTFMLQVVLLLSCNAQKKYLRSNTICDFDQTITEKEKSLTISRQTDSLFLKGNILLEDNDTLHSELYKHPIYNSITNKQTNKQINIDKMLVYENNKLIGVYFQYNKGNLNIGLEKNYDEEGNVIKTIDHDKGYSICWVQAIEIVKQKFRHKLKKHDSIQYILRRPDLNESPEFAPVWSVGILPVPDDKIGETTYYKIDGVTGDYLGKYILKMNYDD